jgi:paraquat-inducible protein A
LTIGCPNCGVLEDIPPLRRGGKAVCIRCDGDLEKTSGRSVAAALACSVATFLLLFPTNLLPLMRVNVLGMHGQNIIAGGIAILWSQGWVLLAGTSAILVVVLPFIRFGLVSVVLASVQFGYRPAWLGRAFRWAMWLDPWAMLDVYLLAGFIGYYRLIHVSAAQVTVEVGGMCFIAAAVLTMLSRATLDRRVVWRALGPEVEVESAEGHLACTTCDLVQPLSREGEKCPRCGAGLSLRSRTAMQQTTALLIAAFILFFPANLYPMDVSHQLGSVKGYTIFTGISDLFQNGLWPLGVTIFCTSILVPAGKIFAVAWCVLSVWRRSDRHLVAKTKLFRAVAELGRWSKTDPLTIVFFVPLMNFRPLASANAGWGATAFVLTSVLTMIASYTFDPRLMWDAAAARAREQG